MRSDPGEGPLAYQWDAISHILAKPLTASRVIMQAVATYAWQPMTDYGVPGSCESLVRF